MNAVTNGTAVFIGTQGSGPDQGIHAAWLDEREGALKPLGLAAVVERPTWVTYDPIHSSLYAVSEIGNAGDRIGEVLSFQVGARRGALEPIRRVSSGGCGPTHLALEPGSRTLFVANFGDGTAVAIPISQRGALEDHTCVRTGTGSGPHRRQARPHAHGVTLDPSGRYLLVPDMGADRIFVYPYEAASRTLGDDPRLHVRLPAGSGPRLVLFGKDGRFAYLLTELSAEVHVFRWDSHHGELAPAGRVELDLADFGDSRSAGGLAISPDGGFLYASNRRTHEIHVFSIDPDDGQLTPVQTIASGGERPWATELAPSGRWLLAANQGSSTVQVFGVDAGSGELASVGEPIFLPSPTSFAFCGD